MTALLGEIRAGAYADSIVLLQLQRALRRLPGVVDAGVAMGTEANLEILETGGLLTPEAARARPEDLVLTVRAESEAAALEALRRVDELMTRNLPGDESGYRPRRLAAAARLLPEARWVAISVPGKHAGAVAREALELDRHVFLFSDNVSLDEEIELKRMAAERGRLVLGPDCGTSLVAGIGLGFANRVRRGSIGLVAASGTGLQAVACRIQRLGAGVSHALGTGGRDLSSAVAGATAVRALALLADDPGTEVLVLVAKPPEPEVAGRLLRTAWRSGKPVVVHFLGQAPPARRLGPLHFASSLDDAGSLAVELARAPRPVPAAIPASRPASRRRYLRGLFAGGTLAQQFQQSLLPFLPGIRSNVPLAGVGEIPGTAPGMGHTIVDLGADELTVGRLHPMLDEELRLRRLAAEAADPEVGVILLDVVLGDGVAADPAGDLAPAIGAIRGAGGAEVIVFLIGTDRDPQDLEGQTRRLEGSGARVHTEVREALAEVLERLDPGDEPIAPVSATALEEPVAVLNVGLESFADSLAEQGAPVVRLDWRPAAGGDPRLQAILQRMKG